MQMKEARSLSSTKRIACALTVAPLTACFGKRDRDRVPIRESLGT